MNFWQEIITLTCPICRRYEICRTNFTSTQFLCDLIGFDDNLLFKCVGDLFQIFMFIGTYPFRVCVVSIELKCLGNKKLQLRFILNDVKLGEYQDHVIIHSLTFLNSCLSISYYYVYCTYYLQGIVGILLTNCTCL